MPDFPIPRWPVLNVITPFHVESSAMPIRAAGLSIASLASAAPGANLVLYWPFLVFEPSTAVKMSYIVGATSNGNCDVGIYDAEKNRLINSGSTAQGTANTLQEVDITDTTLTPGLYFMALTLSSGTGTAFRASTNDDVGLPCFPQYLETTGGFGLPATAAFALTTVGTVFIPALAVHFDTLI